MSFSLKDTESALQDVLRDPYAYRWTASGLGMIRCYLSPDESLRLHVWNRKFRAPGASMIHTHPWMLQSTVVRGSLKNYVYEETNTPAPGAANYFRRPMRCGATAGCAGNDALAQLRLRRIEFYAQDDTYSHRQNEIHETDAADGTVTILRRTMTTRDYAYIYWPSGTEFGDSYQRPATAHEIDVALNAIARSMA